MTAEVTAASEQVPQHPHLTSLLLATSLPLLLLMLLQ